MLAPDLDPRLLGTLRAVVEAGSITLAARRLHVSQPALTAQIRKLESTLGQPLLERRARGVVPTEAGARLLPLAERLDALLEEATALTRTAPRERSPLVLGASTTVASYVVPALLGAYAERYGHAGVRVVVGNTSQILEAVHRGEVPLGLVEGPPRAAHVRLEHYLDDELLPMAAPDARALHVRDAEGLADVPLLFREVGSGTREVVERALRPLGRRLRPTDLELGSTEAILTAAKLGLGVAFLSRFVAGADLDAGRLRPLRVKGLSITRKFSFALPPRDLSGPAARFYELARRSR